MAVIISMLVYLAIAIYLASSFHRHRRRNQTTAFWAWGFLLLGMTNSCFLVKNIVCESSCSYWWYLPIIIGWMLGFILILYGTFLLFTRTRILLWIPWLVGVLGAILAINSLMGQTIVLSNFLLYSFLIWIPLVFLMAILYFSVFGQLVMIKLSFTQNLGSLLLGLGWLSYGVEVALLPFVIETPYLAYWFLFHILTGLLLFGGIVMLEKEAHSSLDNHLKIHGLKQGQKESPSA